MQIQPFWPDNAAEWSGLLVGIILFLGSITGLIIKISRERQKSDDQLLRIKEEIDRRFEEQGKRIGGIEGDCSGQSSALDDLRTASIHNGLEMNTNTREVSRIGGSIDKLDNELYRHLRDAANTEKMVRERLARIEERLRLPTMEL